MGTETITIKATNKNPTPLILADNEGHHGNSAATDKAFTTKVSNGDTVKWKNKNNSDITSFSIQCDSNNVFVPGDPKIKSNGNWEGTISDSASGDESYSVIYYVEGTKYTQDPKLRIKSSGSGNV